MRKIGLYRGQRVDNGELVCGWYVVDELVNEDGGEIHYIIPRNKHLELYNHLSWIKVIPQTVTQEGDLEVIGNATDNPELLEE